MAARQRDWPHAMTTLSTHDTKRGEDVRARITVLAELPDDWAEAARPAARAGAAARPRLREPAVAGRRSAPGRRRASGCTRYAEKAMREAGDRTTWTDPDDDVRGGRPRRRRRGVRRRRGARGARRAASTGSPAPGWSNAPRRRSCVALTMPGRAGRLPGQRAVGAEPGRPGQPAPRRLRRCAARLLARVRDGERPVLTPSVDDRGARQAARHPRGAHAAPRPPRAVHRRTRPLRGRRRGRRPRARVRPRRRDHRRHPAAGRARRARRLGRHRARRCPRAPGRDVLTGRRATPATAPAAPTCSPTTRSRCWSRGGSA